MPKLMKISFKLIFIRYIEQMINKLATLPIFSNSVRVFFPLAALIATLVPMYTVCVVVNAYPFSSPHFTLFEWHGYEMLFSFFYTLIMGFILTAGAHWTNQTPIHGWPLISLFCLWILDQAVLFLVDSQLLLMLSAMALSGYFMYLITKLLWTYPKKWMFLFIFTFISVAKILFVYGGTQKGFWYKDHLYDFSAWLFSFMAIIIGGRVTPNFTKNTFKLKTGFQAPEILTKISIASTAAIGVTPFITNPTVNMVIYLTAGISNFIKVCYWYLFEALKKPIIGMLHIGYFVLSISFIFTGLSYVYDGFNFSKADLHLMLTGGVSILALNIMVRATLGHTGRKIKMDWVIAIMYASVFIGSLIRFIVPIFWPDFFIKSLHQSMGFWTLAFLIYFIRFLPVVFKKRADA